jgi:hypothetical protein
MARRTREGMEERVVPEEMDLASERMRRQAEKI